MKWLALALLAGFVAGQCTRPVHAATVHAAEGEYRETTGYCYTGQRTASGTWPARGTVAAPRDVPFGTPLSIEGYSDYAVVADRGGAIYGNRLDLYFPTCWEAIQWGRRWVWVTDGSAGE